MGTRDLKFAFGKAQDNTVIPNHFRKGSSAVIQNVCNGLKKAGLVEVKPEGHVLSDKGKKMLDQFAQ